MREKLITEEEFVILTDKQNNKIDYQPKEGDRIYVSKYSKIKKRELDKYLKAHYDDIKRVSKVEDASVILDTGSLYGLYEKYHIRTGSQSTFERHVWSWVERKILDHLKSKLSTDEFKLCSQKDRWGFHHLNVKHVIKTYPDVLSICKTINISDEKNVTVEDLVTKEYSYDNSIKQSISKYINGGKESSEDIDINNIVMLLTADNSDSVDLAVQLMNGFDMREHYCYLTYLFYSGEINGYGQQTLRKYLIKQPEFDCGIAVSGSKSSNIYREGFYNFKDTIKSLEKNNVPIDYNFIIEKLFHNER